MVFSRPIERKPSLTLLKYEINVILAPCGLFFILLRTSAFVTIVVVMNLAGANWHICAGQSFDCSCRGCRQDSRLVLDTTIRRGPQRVHRAAQQVVHHVNALLSQPLGRNPQTLANARLTKLRLPLARLPARLRPGTRHSRAAGSPKGPPSRPAGHPPYQRPSLLPELGTSTHSRV